MKTDNELIAEFMGYHKSAQGMWCTPEDLTIIEEPGFKPQEYASRWFPLTFNRDWSELMPVVEKIESLGHVVIIDGLEAVIMTKEDFDRGLVYVEEKTKLESVYCAVARFVKWYNQQEQ